MLVNRVGDFFLLIALFCIYITYDSLDYEIVFTLIPYSLGSEKFDLNDFKKRKGNVLTFKKNV